MQNAFVSTPLHHPNLAFATVVPQERERFQQLGINSILPAPSSSSGVRGRARQKSGVHSPTRLNAAIGTLLTGAAMFALRGGGRQTRNLAIVASGGAGDVAEILIQAYEWNINLGNPSALVAGAVIATIYETMGSGAMDVRKKDTKWVKLGKRMTRVLLLSAFAFEVLSIFVTTVTGTMLMERTLDFMDEIVPVTEDTTPLEFLRNNFEFEYLTARVTFLQGLLNWIAAIGLGHIVPSGDKGNKDARTMNKFIGAALFTSILVMLSFYNKHMTFYRNYGHMLCRWLQVLSEQFVFSNPLQQPMTLAYIPSILASAYFGIKAFFGKGPDDEDELNDNNVQDKDD
ncbi:hypothetical protein ACA910_011787 [Epithemia clementina (nom. ined.)]